MMRMFGVSSSSMPDIYALIVGIDAYPAPLRALEGCVNDAAAMQDLLERRYGARCAVLLNEQATRQNIIDGFRGHLAQARAGDSAVFFYAGHGSQVPTGGLFEKIEASVKLQSLVCIDSRPDGYDLVDKDIAVLISELADQGAHVTLLMDSCHSGSISRAVDDRGSAAKPPLTRSAPDRSDLHPPEAFVRRRNVSDADALNMTLASVEGFKPDVSGRHVLVAACESSQSSQEVAEQRHGLFTWCLLQVLESSDEGLTYDELYARVRSLQLQKIRATPNFADQNPRLESLAGDANRMGLFLRMTPAPRTEYFLARFLGGQWMLDGGALHRLSPGDTLAIYPIETANRDLSDVSQAMGAVTIAATDPAESLLETGSLSLDPARQYKAVVRRRMAMLNIALSGDAAGVALLRSALTLAPSVIEGKAPRFTARLEGGQIQLATDSGRKAPGPFAATPEGAAQAAAALEHMAKWVLRLEMTNPKSRIGPEQVQLTLIDKDGREFDCPPLSELELQSMRNASGGWEEAGFTARITNRTGVPFSVALLAFAEDWSIYTGLIAGGTEVLDPVSNGQAFPLYALSGEPIRMTISPGATESHDELMLIVSSDNFNADALALEPFAPQAMTRGFAAAAQQAVPSWQHDFATRRLHIHTIRGDA